MANNDVAVPKPVLLALGAALVVALVVVGFLLGRQTTAVPVVIQAPAPPAPPPVPAPRAPAAPTAPAAAPSAVPEPTLVARGAEGALAEFLGQDTDAAPDGAPVASDPVPTTTIVVAEPPATDDTPATDDGASVAAYFTELDLLTASHATVDDPKAVSLGILKSSLNGDPSELKALRAQHEASLRAVERLVPPEPCRAHHAAMLDVMREGIAVLDATSAATARGGDPGAAMAIAARGQALMSKTKAVDELADALRRRYGLGR